MERKLNSSGLGRLRALVFYSACTRNKCTKNCTLKELFCIQCWYSFVNKCAVLHSALYFPEMQNMGQCIVTMKCKIIFYIILIHCNSVLTSRGKEGLTKCSDRKATWHFNIRIKHHMLYLFFPNSVIKNVYITQ